MRQQLPEVAGGCASAAAGAAANGAIAAAPNASNNQHYSLRWNNHQSHVLNAFEALLQNESLVDCTLVCEDTSIRAHKVVLSACSPYFQKIFVDNPCKHPIIVLKDIRGWEVQCIVDFMYKGETSVPEAQLTSLIKAAESLKVRGLTSSDQVSSHRNSQHMDTSSAPPTPTHPPPAAPASTSSNSPPSSSSGAPPRSRSPPPHAAAHPPPMHHPMNGYPSPHPPPSAHHGMMHRGYSPSPARSTGGSGGAPYMHPLPHQDAHTDAAPSAKMPHMSSHSSQSSPMSLTNHQDDRDRARAGSPGPAGSVAGGSSSAGPRRKQARPRRRSGDSIGNASLDLSKSDSPPLSSNLSGASNNNGFGGGASGGDTGNGGSSSSNMAKNSSASPGSGQNQQHPDETPENLSLNRPSSSPAINLVKTEHLMDESRSRDHSRGPPPMERAHSSDPHLRGQPLPPPPPPPPHPHMMGHPPPPPQPPRDPRDPDQHVKPPPPSSPFLAAAAAAAASGGQGPDKPRPPYGNGLGIPMQEHEARAEALQALNFMAAGGGLPPHFPPGHPLAGHPGGPAGHRGVGQPPPHLTPSSLASLAAAGAAAAAAAGRPTSTPSTPSNSFPGPRGPKGQHSAPRGGPPRSWTNDELTKALENVWNKRMTTSQASRVYGIPYNSLLMYVRGKYGKSLKLDKLKKNTPAAHDTLNTIGNSRSTPKEKLLAKANKAAAAAAAAAIQQAVKNNKENHQQKQLGSPPQPLLKTVTQPLHGHATFPGGEAALQDCSGRIKDLIMDMHNQQALLNHTERLKELEKHLPPEQAKVLLPFLERQAVEMAAMASSGVSPPGGMPGGMTAEDFMAHSPSTLASLGSAGGEDMMMMEEDEDEVDIEVGDEDIDDDIVDDKTADDVTDKERQVRDILIEAAAKRASKDSASDNDHDDEDEGFNDKKDDTSPAGPAPPAKSISSIVPKPAATTSIPVKGNEISAL